VSRSSPTRVLGGLQWSRTAPRPYELAVRNEAEEIFVAFKLQLAAPVRPWHSPHTRRLVVTHVGVPEPFRRRGVLSRTMDALAEAVLPDEIEVDRVLSDTMRAYCCSRGYDLVPAQPGEELAGGSYRRPWAAGDGAGAHSLAGGGADRGGLSGTGSASEQACV